MPDEFDWEDHIYEEHERWRQSQEELQDYNEHLWDNMSKEERLAHREKAEKEFEKMIEYSQEIEFERKFREKHLAERGARLIVDGVVTLVDGRDSLSNFHININYNDTERWVHLILQWSNNHPSEAWMEELFWIPEYGPEDETLISELTKGLTDKGCWDLSEALTTAIDLGFKPYFRLNDKSVEYKILRDSDSKK
ncbi:MAG: hypothetical protein R2797_14065 [Gelidibacter sp.]